MNQNGRPRKLFTYNYRVRVLQSDLKFKTVCETLDEDVALTEIKKNLKLGHIAYMEMFLGEYEFGVEDGK